MRRGFTLVEMSIVLVIIGLLVGGIVAGQSLIRAAELRSIPADYNRFVSAGLAFMDKYGALPGDLKDATSYWGDNASYCSDGAIANGNPGTCNGNGDNTLSVASAVSTTGEMHQFWNQLALAGMVEGKYTGIAGPGSTADVIIGTNAPAARITNAGWAVRTYNAPGDTSEYTNDFGTALFLGYQTTNSMPIIAIMTPREQWNIDKKMDDGMPASGKMWARDTGGFGNTNACTTSTSKTDYAGEYKISTPVLACTPWFAQAL